MDDDILEDITRPIKNVEEKWKLLPHFLRMRGLMRQHIDSFDHFVNEELRNIVAAKSNCEVRSEADPKFYLRYTDIYIGTPNVEEEAFVTANGNTFIGCTEFILIFKIYSHNYCSHSIPVPT